MAHHAITIQSLLRSQGAHDPSTRGHIERSLFNILWASFVTFKLPQSPRSKSLFHSLSFTLHCSSSFSERSRLFAIFVLPAHSPSPTTPILKGMIFPPSMTLLLHCLALCVNELPGTVYLLALLYCSCVSLFPHRSPLSRVGRVCRGFLFFPLFLLQTPFR